MRPAPRPRSTARKAALLLALALGVLPAAGCGGGDAGGATSSSNPVMLVGVDGLEPSIVARLLAEGRMPNLARFASGGVLGSIDTLDPTWSPVIWTTVATGRSSEVHGVVDFLEEATSLPYTSNARRVPAIWNLVSEAERTIDVVGWWITWPAEPINGRMLASYAAQAQAHIVWKPGVWQGLPDLSYPASLAQQLSPILERAGDTDSMRSEFGQAIGVLREPPYDEPLKSCMQDLRWTFNADYAVAEATEWMLESGAQADLTMLYLSTPDVAGHRFWRYYRPDDFHYEVDASEVADFGHVLDASYVEIDRRLGRLLERVAPETNVIVMSDHGMHADPEHTGSDSQGSKQSGHHQLRPPGIFAALGPDVRSDGDQLQGSRPLLGHVLGVAPLLLHLLDLGIPEDWPMAPVAENTLEARVLSDAILAAGRRRLVVFDLF